MTTTEGALIPSKLKTLENPNIEKELAAQLEPFKKVVFSGGGAKGIIYSGAYEALYEANIFKGINELSGSSAGALIAGVAAAGIEPKDLKKILSTSNIANFTGQGIGKISDITIRGDGKPLYDFIKTNIERSIIKQFKSPSNGTEIGYSEKLIDAGIDINASKNSDLKKVITKIQNLEKKYDNKKISNKNSPIITFKDLSVLHKYFPENFKELAITATEQDARKLKIFNSKNTPDIEVALACRASASFPIVFKETKINGKNYIDGGFVNNTPQENFDKLPSGRTLALIFADKNDKEAYKIVYSEEPIKEEKQSFFKKILEYVKMFFLNIFHPKKAGNIFDNAKNDMMDIKRSNNITNEHIRNNAMNTIILDTGEVTTLDFDKAQRLSLYLHLKGSVAAETYMQNYNLKPRDSTIDFRNFMIDLYEKHYSKILNDNTVDNKQLDPLMNKILDFCENEKWQNHSITDNIKEFKDIVSINNIESKKLNESIKEILDKKDISSVVLKEFNDFYKKENNQNNTIDNQVSNHVQTLIYNRENNIARPDNIRARG